MRTRLATTWLVAAGILVVGAGMVGASAEYRRIAAGNDRLARTEAKLKEHQAVVARLTAEAAELRTQLSVSSLKIRRAGVELQSVRQ